MAFSYNVSVDLTPAVFPFGEEKKNYRVGQDIMDDKPASRMLASVDKVFLQSWELLVFFFLRVFLLFLLLLGGVSMSFLKFKRYIFFLEFSMVFPYNFTGDF